MLPYSPFDKPLSKLTGQDLAVLRQVPEGWYVEYKTAEIKASDYAKAVSAFANTYGGWLFIGVGENEKENPVAGTFPGIPTDDLDACLSRLRQGVATSLNPSPHFETATIAGPCDDIGLEAGKSIVCVSIPQSQTAPHVHKDGRIYRRVSDSSDPKPETDRYFLDQLFQRGNAVRKGTKKWILRDPEFSKEESKHPFFRLLFAVDPWQEKDPWLNITTSEFRSLMAEDHASFQSIPFDSIHHTSAGFVARQTQGNDPGKLGLTLKFHNDLSGELIVPLTFFESSNYSALAVELLEYDHGDKYLQLLNSQGFEYPRIIDLNILLPIITGFVRKYRNLLRTAGVAKPSFYVKSRLLNVWRCCPFLDIEPIVADFETHKIPVALSDIMMHPIGGDPDSFSLIEDFDNELDYEAGVSEYATCISQARMIFVGISLAFGLPVLLPNDEDAEQSETSPISYTLFNDALQRALNSQTQRNKRRTQTY